MKFEKKIMLEIDFDAERKEILGRYRTLVKSCRPNVDKADKPLIRKAFRVALEAHKNMRRKSGEPYIFHPIAVAQIVAQEIGLGATSVICALLHDTVEDTDITLDDVKKMFGEKIAKIIDGLTKISGIFDSKSSMQAENFRKMLLTLGEDVRVILIKLADRLHNMRTLEHMAREKQLKIASETLYLFGPLAHRLGLYAIKSELEDLALKYTEPDIYESITQKLRETQEERNIFINTFIAPIKRALDEQGFSYEIFGRSKSIRSIWDKMRKKEIPFEEVFDLLAVRIIIDVPFENEKSECWKVYSFVTDFYRPRPDRLRDWISNPKSNGYESLHTTVMSSTGKWVEVQIRTKRMDQIAEKGYAAHWKYKESGSNESGLDEWMKKIREILQNPNPSAMDFLDDFKMNLFSEEIFIFTPKGDLKSLPKGSTTLDFAYTIHSQIGYHCIGAKVNHKLVPLSQELKSGDQVEILTSHKQKPREDWLKYVITARAKSKIKNALKEDKKRVADEGKEILERKFREVKLEFNQTNLTNLQTYYKISSLQDLFYDTAIGKITIAEVRNFVTDSERGNWFKYITNKFSKSSNDKTKSTNDNKPEDEILKNKPDTLLIGDDLQNLNYTLSSCCNPIQGDDVFGFITINEGIKIHRINCPNAVQLRAKYAYRVIKAKWASKDKLQFLCGIQIKGTDEVGIVNNITRIISNELHINIRSLNFDSQDGIFEGTIMLYIQDSKHLEDLIVKLKEIHGVQNINRIE